MWYLRHLGHSLKNKRSAIVQYPDVISLAQHLHVESQIRSIDWMHMDGVQVSLEFLEQ
jgi:hypothetical protein